MRALSTTRSLRADEEKTDQEENEEWRLRQEREAVELDLLKQSDSETLFF